LSRAAVGALALVAVGVMIGSVHALYEPIIMRVEFPGSFTNTPLIGPAGTDSSTASGDASAEPNESTLVVTSPGNSADPSIGLEAAYEYFVSGEALFIDSRRPEEFAESRIAGAVFLDSSMITSGQGGEALDTVISFGYEQLLILYCHGGDCDSSVNTAGQLMKLGFTNIRIMRASFDEWRDAGYETEDGE
jgi:rhodanese-related sulfurtransferase